MTHALTTPTTAAVARTSESTGGLSGAGLATVLIGSGLSALDFFIVNVALPTIQRTLNASDSTLELVVAGYGISYCLFLVLGGRLGDMFGRRRLFLVGMAAFTVTSLACGLAPTAGVLVAARMAQGAAAALMLPQVLSTIQAATSGEARSKALGLYGANAGLSMVLGQLLGGVMVAADIAGTGWRSIFLVNVPIGLIGLVLARRNVPETRATNPAGVDLPGTVLFGLGMFALLVPLMEGRTAGWPAWMWVLLAVSPVAFGAFVVVERKIERGGRVPLLPPSVMRMPSMRRGLSMGAPIFMGFGGFMFVAAVTLQNGLRLGPATAGLALTPMAVAFLAASLISSRLVTRYGRTVLTIGAAIQTVGILTMIGTILAAWPDVTPWELAPGMAIAGFGQGLLVTTLFRVVLSRVPVASAGVGSGSLVTVQQASLALGVATLGTLYLWLSEPGVLGMRVAFAVVMGVQVVIAIISCVYSRRLPDPRQGS
ncbi:MFS transporter [Actinocrispum wychmicini]|uniref:Putative MFS family arabinose efflux permease n=1 Tax=Actinocrispum wychmicini TaxID=1213861 RepID=A0A4R2JYR0_9PSEU|nr:MFS transporter [Actinocrispum wychmicini]TCO62588.1 putative MFS family arabinose efflux permease [Actinocrispum wychmicini]